MNSTSVVVVLSLLLLVAASIFLLRRRSRRVVDARSRRVRQPVDPAQIETGSRVHSPAIPHPTVGEKLTKFVVRSLDAGQARAIASQVLSQLRFHTGYIKCQPDAAVYQFVLPNGARFVVRDAMAGTRRMLTFTSAKGFSQFRALIAVRTRKPADDQAIGWFIWPMTDREESRLLDMLCLVIDTAYNAADPTPEPGAFVIEPGMPLARSGSVGPTSA